jgi:hypothetical protein
MNVTIEKEQPLHDKIVRLERLNIHRQVQSCKSSPSPYNTADSTCESSGGVSMNCSEEFLSDTIIEKSEDFSDKSREMTSATVRPQSGSLDTCKSQCTTEEAIYYFGYGPIVNPHVRIRRGLLMAPENIKSAILYDHRLRFVPGGTANVEYSRGWDVKGVLLKFESQQEWEEFRQFDANYDVQEISVSVIDKTNLDPKKKNDHTAPFEDEEGNDQEQYEFDEFSVSERSGPLLGSQRMYKSMLMPGINGSLNDLDGSSSEDEDYSCPFSFEPKSKKPDPNAVKAFTFMIDQKKTGHRHRICENTPLRTNGAKGESVVGRPQERYLTLIRDGLRLHDVDETYIRDEILAVNYISNERDRFGDQNYKTFPSAKSKLPKMSSSKYDKKVEKEPQTTLFVIGTRMMKVDGEPDWANPVVRWLRAVAHGKDDISLLVHKTFVDKDCIRIPEVKTAEELTDQHRQWAEHVVFLYLERGGLSATAIAELEAGDGKKSKSKHKWSGRSMPLLGRAKKKNKESDLDSSDLGMDAPHSTPNLSERSDRTAGRGASAKIFGRFGKKKS